MSQKNQVGLSGYFGRIGEDMLTKEQLESVTKVHVFGGVGTEGIQPSEVTQTALAYFEMLERLEWVPDETTGGHSCYICGGTKVNGHLPDCELAALLEGLR